MPASLTARIIAFARGNNLERVVDRVAGGWKVHNGQLYPARDLGMADMVKHQGRDLKLPSYQAASRGSDAARGQADWLRKMRPLGKKVPSLDRSVGGRTMHAWRGRMPSPAGLLPASRPGHPSLHWTSNPRIFSALRPGMICFGDDRPRDNQGQFSPEDSGGVDPVAMIKVYGPPPMRLRVAQRPKAPVAPDTF